MQMSRALLLAVGLFEVVLECQALSAGLEAVLSAGDYDEVPGHSCPGGNMGIVTANFVNKCKTECDDETTCIGFVRIESSNKCYLKGADNCNMTEHFQANSNKDAYFKVGYLNGTVNAGLAGLPTLAPTAAPTAAPTLAPTAAQTPAPTAAQTPAPTAATTTSPTAGPVNPAAVGDPHLVNMHGQRFDLYQPGSHTLIQVPKGAGPERALLRVDALADKLGDACGDLYFTVLNVTGHWANAGLGLRFFAGKEPKPSGSWQTFGHVSMKIKAGSTAEGIDYLNIYTRDLSKVGFPVGGLLGDDDHTAVSNMVANCKRNLVLMQQPVRHA